MNNHLYSHSFLLLSKCSPSDFSLTVMPDMSVSAASPWCWRLSYLVRDPSHTMCSWGKYSPGTSPFLLSGSTPEQMSCPWSLPELCHRDLISYCLDCGWLGYQYLSWTCFITRAGVANTSLSVTPVTLPAPHWCPHLDVVDPCCPQCSAASATPGMSAAPWQNSLPLTASWHMCRKLPTRVI